MGRPKKDKTVTKVRGLRVIIYLRVSGDVQLEGNGLEAQEDACIGYASREGYVIVDTLRDEAISGTKDFSDRPGLTKAMGMCVTGQADVFLCYALDRQSRDVVLFNTVRSQLKKAKVRFETVKENQDFTTDDSMLMGDIYAAFAAEERRRITARLYGGRKVRSKRDGLGSGPLPYGFKKIVETVGTETTITLLPDEAAIPIIRLVLSERKKGVTYNAVANMLTQKGYKTPKGKNVWRVSTIQAIEKHEELYRTGLRVWDEVNAREQWPILIKE